VPVLALLLALSAVAVNGTSHAYYGPASQIAVDTANSLAVTSRRSHTFPIADWEGDYDG
jgi:hypothetical protein